MLVLLLMVAGQAAARTVTVNTTSSINKTWQAGDTIVFTSGSYNNFTIKLSGNGTADQPIVLKAQTAGQTRLSGSSTLTFNGTYIEVQGLTFTGNYTGTSHIVQFSSSSSHCRLTDCSIESYNNTNSEKDYKWISLRGKENRIDHCLFENKTNIGTLLVVWLEDNIIPQHHIDHNYFHTRTALLDDEGKELNGQEIIRIGDSNTSMQTASCIVESNLFEDCDGEIEIISNKSCGNIYRNNCFIHCAGMLTLRHGNNCFVDGNFFFGNGKASTGGVRIIGENHTVINNYFYNLTGSNYRAAICIVRGKENSALNEYYQVKNAEIANNTIVNCKEAFAINYNSSSDCTMPPLNTIIENNHVFNDQSNKSNRLINLAQDGGSVVWRNNLMNQGKFQNITPSDSQVITGQDPQMQVSDDITLAFYEPQEGTALVSYTTTLPDIVTTDILGRERPEHKLPGCSEITGTITRQIPQQNNTGPRWKPTFTDTPTHQTLLPTPPTTQKIFRNGQIIILSNNCYYTILGEKIK